MSRARDLSKLGNPNVIKADTTSVGFGTQVAGNPANAASSLISAGIVTATAFYGDGSNLEGVASAGLGTAVDDTKDSIGQNIYYTNEELSIYENTTVNAPATSDVAYTQYSQVTVEPGKELIIADGDTFIPDVLGIGTGLQAVAAGAGNGLFGTVYVDNIENVAGRGGPNFPLGATVVGVLTASTGSFSGNVSIGGTLTYEDVTNVDSIGVVTARNGIKVTTGGIDVTAGGIDVTAGGIDVTAGDIDVLSGSIGIGEATPDGNKLIIRGASTVGTKSGHIMLTGDSSTVDEGPQIVFSESGGAANWAGGSIGFKRQGSGGIGDLIFGTRGSTGDANTSTSERLRIRYNGAIGIAGANYGTDGQVLTSKGNSAAVEWATPASGGLTEWDQWSFVNNLSNLGQNMSTAQDLGSGSMGVIWQRINTSQNPGFEKIGVGMTHSSGVFTFPSVGKYEVSCHVQFRSWDQGRSGLRLSLFTSADGGSSWHGSDGTYYMEESTSNANYAFATLNVDGFINVDNTTNKKCKFVVKHNGENSAQIGIFGSASTVRTNCIFKKLN